MPHSAVHRFSRGLVIVMPALTIDSGDESAMNFIELLHVAALVLRC